jgi:tetratricopeptide (TPR) repeat protein
MSTTTGAGICPNDQMEDLLSYLRTGGSDGEHRVAGLIASYPRDGRLQFLRGSMLATGKQYDEARAAMRAAIDLAPYFWLARFQLGLLELTSGLPAEAIQTWAPLRDLAADNPLRLFSDGLQALIRDEFAEAVGKLRQGIGANIDNPPLNSDMQMMIDKIQSADGGSSGEPISATQLLLQTLGRSAPTKH